MQAISDIHLQIKLSHNNIIKYRNYEFKEKKTLIYVHNKLKYLT